MKPIGALVAIFFAASVSSCSALETAEQSGSDAAKSIASSINYDANWNEHLFQSDPELWWHIQSFPQDDKIRWSGSFSRLHDKQSGAPIGWQGNIAIKCAWPLHDTAPPCPAKGDSKETRIWILDTLKNRQVAPSSLNSKITLDAVLAPGDDSTRFEPTDAAAITGYVVAVKRGALESCNCHSPINRDWHIELAETPKAKPSDRMIVEITPRLNVAVSGIINTSKPFELLIGKRVTVTGWLFFDEEHKQNARNTNPRGTDIWRATCWEIHPVTSIKVLDNILAMLRPPFPRRTSDPDRWLDELSRGEIDRDEYRSLIAGAFDLRSMAWMSRSRTTATHF